MDHIDEKILSILQSDGRISMSKLARALPMSVPATCERVHKLEDSGAIRKYTIAIDPVKIGKTISAFILFAPHIGKLDESIAWARQDPHIVSCWTLAGKYGLMLHVLCEDMKDYADFIKELFPIGTSESYIIIDEAKGASYFPGFGDHEE